MDLLFSRYASPMDFMRMYIEQGRFGEFVDQIINLENERKREEAEKEDDNKLWIAYVHSMSDMPFKEWKEGLWKKQKEQPATLSMTDEQVEETKQQSRGILRRFSPK